MEIRRPTSAPPTLEDEDTMIVEANVEVGARATRKRKRNLLFAWDYRDETCHGGDGGGESVSDVDVDVVLSADGHIRARIGHSGMGMVSGGRGQSWKMARAHILLCGGCICERVLRIDLVLIEIWIPLVSKDLRN